MLLLSLKQKKAEHTKNHHLSWDLIELRSQCKMLPSNLERMVNLEIKIYIHNAEPARALNYKEHLNHNFDELLKTERGISGKSEK